LGESNVTWSLERSFNDPTSSLTDTVYSFVRLATNWTATSDKIGVMALDESGVDALAWIWNGSNSTVSNFIELTASASIGTQEVMGLAFESSSGNLMIVAGEGNDMRYARFTTSWQTSALFGTWAVGNIRWVTIKANPVSTSNEIFVAASGGLSDLDSAYWSGSAWTNHSEHDSDIDSSTTRVFDYSWNGLNSSGILIWGTTSGSLSYKRFTASNTFSSTGTFSESGTHPWVVLNNPNPSTSDPILVFGATIDSNNQVGGLKWGGGSTPPQSTGDGGAGAPGSTQFLSLSVAWQKEMGPWGTDIPVDITGNHTREVHLATSPTSNTLVAAYITQLIPTPELRCEVRPSFNGGLKWGRSTAMANFSGLPSSLQADPVVAAKSSGEFTLMCLEVVLSDSSRIFTSTSSDGLIWSTTQQAAIATYPVELDKPWMVIDNNSSSPYKDNVYACWTRNNGTSPGSSSEIVFKRLGPTSLPEKVLYKSPLVTRTQLGCNMAIGTNGEIYITWLDILDKSSGIIKFRWNTLGGEEWGWGRLQNISSVNRFRFLNIAQINGQAALIKAGNDPSIAVDLLGGVHVVYAENSTQTKSGGDIKYVNSNDCRKGSKVDRCSWSSPLTISIGISGVLVWQDQWEPAIHISNDGPKFPSGVVHVTALDRRNDPLNIKWHVWEYYCAPGITLGCRNTRDWVYRPVSDVAMHNEGLKEVGDYHAVTSTKSGKVYTAWTDTRKYILNNFDIMGDWTKR